MDASPRAALSTCGQAALRTSRARGSLQPFAVACNHGEDLRDAHCSTQRGIMKRSVAGVITNRRAKYVVLVFWLLLIAIAWPLAGKLNGAEKNDAKTWLPGSTESTKVLDAHAAFLSPNTARIDYNIFLMTRVREETSRHGTRRATLIALSATGGVITSAGLVLAGTFSVLATLPLTAFAEIGFTVALGVLLDTLIVRSILVTALNLDLGPRIWWPNKHAKTADIPAAEAPQPALTGRR
jgi:uncharacterized membrane protein YdfJ with MMPL/SSD domain